MPFIDVRGHAFTNGRLAGNIGIGGRTLINSIEHIFGAYVYYDVRNEKHDLTVHQIGPGIEPSTNLGPLVSEQQVARVCGYMDSGIKEGARSRAPDISSSLPFSWMCARR